MELVDKAGQSVSDYIEACITDAKDDAVALSDIVWWGRNQFCIDDEVSLASFVVEVVTCILESGATVSRANSIDISGWVEVLDYLEMTPGAAAVKIFEAHKADEEEGNFGVWFLIDN